MSFLSLVLFGSRARGDSGPRSDVDLLLITNEKRPRHAKVETISLSCYPLNNLIHMAESGDLFVLHILQEGKILVDPAGLIDTIRVSFRVKTSYKKEIMAASDLGWMLARFGSEFSESLTAKRITWCARTILISISAQNGTPIFSISGLKKIKETKEAHHLLMQKDEALDASAFLSLRTFLENLGLQDPCQGAKSANDYRDHFLASENDVALNMLNSEYKPDSNNDLYH